MENVIALIRFVLVGTEKNEPEESANKENKSPRYTKSQARQRYKKGKT